MTQRKKLIELIHEFGFSGYEMNDLADYLIASGVVVLPCKVGDTVYVTDLVFGKAITCEVSCFNAIENGETGTIEYKVPKDIPNIVSVECGFDEIGKTVFMNLEEAEAALKEKIEVTSDGE